MTLSTAEHLLRIFSARDGIHATARYDGANVTYKPVHVPLTMPLLEQHLQGDICLGAYQLSASSNVNWLGWDIDSDNLAEAKKSTLKILAELGSIPHTVEYSGSKGYHVLIFLAEPMFAEEAKKLVESVRANAGLSATGETHCECYPKQTRITPANPLGSLLKIPLGLHPRTHNSSRFVDPENGWEGGPSIDPEVVLSQTVSLSELSKLTNTASAEDSIVNMLVPLWSVGQRHQLALAVSGVLGNIGWGMEACETLIGSICVAANDTDSGNRVGAVRDTYRKIVEHQTVAGYSVLMELLPGAVLRQFMDLATSVRTEGGVRRLDEIRLGRGPKHLKVRAAESMLWVDLSTSGKWVRNDNDLHYLEAATHTLHTVSARPRAGDTFSQLLHRKYGLNPMEEFGNQTYAGLIMQAFAKARHTTICRTVRWDGSKLYVCLNGHEVYVLDGDTVRVCHNGDEGVLFETRGRDDFQIDANMLERVSSGTAWKYLTDELSFARTSTVNVHPEQQRALLRAWILSTFFPECAPTKPLLVAIGVPGSGKTTALRRILKVLEGWDADVLEMAADKPDSLRSSISSHHILVLDNLERSGAKWLADMLNRAATGTHIELRQLYTTNDTSTFKPNCFIGITAVSLPFSDETVFTRLLPIEFGVLDYPRPESRLRDELLEHYGEIWCDLLNTLNRVVSALRVHLSSTAEIRLADFWDFCHVTVEAKILGSEVLEGLSKLSGRQSDALANSSAFIDVLERWIIEYPAEAAVPHAAKDLFSVLQPYARMWKYVGWRWQSAQALTMHIKTLEPILCDKYNCVIGQAKDARQSRTYVSYAFPTSRNNGDR